MRMKTTELHTASHALLKVFADHGVDRAFLVPGESYLGILDALGDFPQIETVTCRHEAGAGMMACADARLTGRPALVMVSRGPGATHAAIAVHTAQQDATPLILVIGQVASDQLRMEGFQEIDYQQMYGSMAKWVYEATDASQLAQAAFKAIRMATSGTPGPVVLVVPEDVQQQAVPLRSWIAPPQVSTQPSPAVLAEVAALLSAAQRPLLVAGGALESERGREALLAFAQAWQVPVAVSFRRHDVFPNGHPLFVGDLGLANPKEQMDAFHSSDLLLAIGTRMGDVTSQGFSFPKMPTPAQAVVHCHPDPHAVGLNFAPTVGAACDPVALLLALAQAQAKVAPGRPSWDAWRARLGDIHRHIAQWPQPATHADGIDFTQVVRTLSQRAARDTIICLDAGTFAVSVYRNFGFTYPQRLIAPISGAMGYGTPAAIASQLRCPHAQVVCLVGDGGFMMSGNEMIAAVERNLPILFIVSDNSCYGSIRIHQAKHYPGRYVGTGLHSPDFARIASGFGMESETVSSPDDVEAAVDRGLRARVPYLLHVKTSLQASLPAPAFAEANAD